MELTFKMEGDADKCVHEIQNLNITPNLNEIKKTMEDKKCLNVENDDYENSWGFNLKELYKIATTFLKDHEGKAFHASYKDKLQLIAYTQQVTHGKYSVETSPPVGYLDVIGRDRRQAWASLGGLEPSEAMEKFIKLLDSVCPLFRPFVKAHKLDLDEKEKKRKEAEEMKRLEEEEAERLRLEEEARRKEEADRQVQIQQKRLIQDALNQQTYHQFKAYAEQQHPGNPEQQASLIRQLQTQHYQQYMQQVLERQFLHQQQQQAQQVNGSSVTNPLSSFSATSLASKPGKYVRNSNNNNLNVKSLHKGQSEDLEDDVNDKLDVDGSSEPDTSEEELDDGTPPIASASMWTRKEIVEFKDSIRQEGGGDSVIRVGHGETVTVRVPTHSDGSCLFWEFATDSYDIGFGVYFEWTKNPGTQVSVHISESEDTDDEDTNEENTEHDQADVERGAARRNNGDLPPDSSADHLLKKPPISVIIPVYRRDCHEEVYAGSHAYPGQGVYLLKFDNSYSLWRSKTLYYRVYYTR